MLSEDVQSADPFHWHEALDRCFLVQEFIQTMLLDHPVFAQHKALASKAALAQSLIGELYQEIGSLTKA